MTFTTNTNIADLDVFLTDLVSFAVTNAGFTNVGNTPIDSDTLYRLSKLVDGVTTYWAFRNEDLVGDGQSISNINIISRIMSTSPVAGNFPVTADGNSGSLYHTFMGTYNLRGPFTGYFFFTDGTNVYSVLEIRPNIYAHLAFGHMTKVGVWTGGAYLTSTSARRNASTPFQWWDLDDVQFGDGNYFMQARLANTSGAIWGKSYFQVANNANFSDFVPLGSLDTGGVTGSGNCPPHRGISQGSTFAGEIQFGTSLFRVAPSTSNLRSPILPLMFFVESSSITGRYEMRGYLENSGYINIANIAPETLTNTDWRVIPLVQKTGSNLTASLSDNVGIAYKEIP